MNCDAYSGVIRWMLGHGVGGGWVLASLAAGRALDDCASDSARLRLGLDHTALMNHVEGMNYLHGMKQKYRAHECEGFETRAPPPEKRMVGWSSHLVPPMGKRS
jgi:hypothetical protein